MSSNWHQFHAEINNLIELLHYGLVFALLEVSAFSHHAH